MFSSLKIRPLNIPDYFFKLGLGFFLLFNYYFIVFLSCFFFLFLSGFICLNGLIYLNWAEYSQIFQLFPKIKYFILSDLRICLNYCKDVIILKTLCFRLLQGVRYLLTSQSSNCNFQFRSIYCINGCMYCTCFRGADFEDCGTTSVKECQSQCCLPVKYFIC